MTQIQRKFITGETTVNEARALIPGWQWAFRPIDGGLIEVIGSKDLAGPKWLKLFRGRDTMEALDKLVEDIRAKRV